MPTKKVTTATLLRGSIYSLRHPDNKPSDPKESLRFERSKPLVITDPKIVKILENMYDETEDGDGEVYEKPIFRIDRNVSAPDDGAKHKPKRLSAHRKIKRRRIA